MAYEQKKVVEALRAFEHGEIVVVTDDGGRENEGDLIVAAVHCTPEKMAFIVRLTSGICAPSKADAKRLNLRVVAGNEAPHATAFTVSVDYRHGTTTDFRRGPDALSSQPRQSNAGGRFRRQPRLSLIANEGGVLMRSGHTNGGRLCRLAKLPPVGVISELVADDGTVMRGEDVAASRQPDKADFVADLIAISPAAGKAGGAPQALPVETAAGRPKS